jgi:hypothetical protein
VCEKLISGKSLLNIEALYMLNSSPFYLDIESRRLRWVGHTSGKRQGKEKKGVFEIFWM